MQAELYIFTSGLVSHSASMIGEIGSEYPTNVYDCNRLLLPILRKRWRGLVV
jgi:hypothetical protein